MKNAYKILDHLGNLGIDGSTILKWVIRMQGVFYELDSYGSEHSLMAGSWVYGNELNGFVKGGQFLNR
jgi:hypothetical protein